jgi:hypothetical protein
MHSLDQSVENDARRFLYGILRYETRCGEWPLGSDVNQLAGYKYANDKAGMVSLLLQRGWMKIIEESGLRRQVKRRYVVTDEGLDALLPPKKLPPNLPDHPLGYPDDEVEYAIISYHLSFFQRRGRWPNGFERARIFTRPGTSKISSARRRAAYERLVADHTLVNVTFWNGKGEYNCYVMPMFSPEYADKHGALFYAPPDET